MQLVSAVAKGSTGATLTATTEDIYLIRNEMDKRGHHKVSVLRVYLDNWNVRIIRHYRKYIIYLCISYCIIIIIIILLLLLFL